MSTPSPNDFAEATFVKSSYSAEGQCVEVGALDHQGTTFYAIGDTKARAANSTSRDLLVFAEGPLTRFLAGVDQHRTLA